MSSQDTMDKPELITGGCLCGSVRYEVRFPEDHDFEYASATCQCTQCRRSTGSLYFQNHMVPMSAFRWTGPTGTLKNFCATPGRQRGFCSECGCFLYWRRETSDVIELAVGCVDEKFLVGDKQAEQGEKGKKGAKGDKGFGVLLASPKRHFWCLNEIEGVTDKLFKGTKWERETAHGVILRED